MSGYPDRLIPSPSDSIYTIEDEQIIGRYNETEKSAFDEDGKFHFFDIIDRRSLPGLSCNMIPPSKYEDLKIKVTNTKYLDYWTPGNEGIKPTDEEYDICENREIYCFKCSDIRIKQPYNWGENVHVMQIDVEHKPLKANYSHCEFVVHDSRRDNPEKKMKGDKERFNLLEFEIKSAMEDSVFKV